MKMEKHTNLNTDSDFRFEESDHTYWLGDLQIPSPTGLLKEFGITGNYPPGYAERGKAVHLAAQYYDEGNLDESSVDEAVKPYLTSYKKWIKKQKLKIILMEKPIFSPSLMFGCTPDRVFVTKARNHLLVDLKTSAHLNKKANEIQTAFQKLAITDTLPFTPARFILQLKQDATIAELIPLTDDRVSEEIAESMLNLHWYRRGKSKVINAKNLG